MVDSALPVTPGAGTNVDGTTEDVNGNFRQVIVIGDPSVNAGRAPVDAVKGLSVKVTEFPAGGVPVTGDVSVNNFPAIQPVSATALPLPSGASTEATLALIKAKTDNLDVLLSTRTKPLDTQAVSAAALPLPSGAATAAKQPALGAAGTPSVDVISVQGESGMTPIIVIQTAASLVQSVTGAAAAAVTATLPAVAGQFHYITLIEIVKYFTAANAASATPLVVTTTNLPGSLAYTFGQPLGAIGVTDKMTHMPEAPIKSSVVNTNTTIVCPATAGIIWRVNVYYYAGA